jgi:glycosyltransferase involved in cell wall biosynthesis
MPGVAMEAGAAGIPVVARDVGWVSDVVIDGTTGVLVTEAGDDAFADGIARALRDGDALGRAASERCRSKFDIEAVAGQWDGALAALVGGRDE